MSRSSNGVHLHLHSDLSNKTRGFTMLLLPCKSFRRSWAEFGQDFSSPSLGNLRFFWSIGIEWMYVLPAYHASLLSLIMVYLVLSHKDAEVIKSSFFPFMFSILTEIRNWNPCYILNIALGFISRDIFLRHMWPALKTNVSRGERHEIQWIIRNKLAALWYHFRMILFHETFNLQINSQKIWPQQMSFLTKTIICKNL